MMYRMASSQALSYAFVTSRNAMYAGFLLFLMVWMVSFSRVRWSTVALPFCPPAWASAILMVFDILLLIILSNIFPKLLAKVIPLSFEHFPFVPLPLYSRIISPVCHWVGILCVCIILLIVCRYMCFTVTAPIPAKSLFSLRSSEQHLLTFRPDYHISVLNFLG